MTTAEDTYTTCAVCGRHATSWCTGGGDQWWYRCDNHVYRPTVYDSGQVKCFSNLLDARVHALKQQL